MENLPREKSCAYNVNSPYLKCAVNPTGDCSECCHYESRQTGADVTVIQATAATEESVLMWEMIEAVLADDFSSLDH